VGHRAKKQAPVNPSNSFGSAKRLLGRKYRSLPRGELSDLGYGVVEAFDGRAAVWCPARGEALTPVEVCGALLAHLADRATRSSIGEASSTSESTSSSPSSPSTSYFISNAVITVPDRFGEEQLGAVQAAAEAAGLKGVRLVHGSFEICFLSFFFELFFSHSSLLFFFSPPLLLFFFFSSSFSTKNNLPSQNPSRQRSPTAWAPLGPEQTGARPLRNPWPPRQQRRRRATAAKRKVLLLAPSTTTPFWSSTSAEARWTWPSWTHSKGCSRSSGAPGTRGSEG